MYYQLKGLVLRAQVSDEADKLVTIYTDGWGKISALVPGAKKIHAKLSSAAEPVAENDFVVYLNHPTSRPKITGAVIVNHYSPLRCDWRRFSMAQACAELTELLTPFNAENIRKYDLLKRTWQLLETAQRPSRIFAAFALRFLKLSGYGFLDYLREYNSGIPEADQRAIARLSTLSGDEVDRTLEIDPDREETIQRYIDGYLRLYLPRPMSTRQFWLKVGAAERRKLSKTA